MRMNTKELRMQERQSYIKFVNAKVREVKDADCLIATYNTGNKFGVMTFDGTAGKPSNHIAFRTEEQRLSFIREHLANQRKRLAYKAERKEQNKGHLTGAAATAKVIREHLKKVFPGVKFSVKSSIFAGGDSVDISWTDGPVSSLVSRITDRYQAGHFNGMEDIYEYRNLDEEMLGCPGAKYVHCQREQSTERIAELEAHCLKHTGKTVEAFLGHGRNSWSYENDYPETWEQQYQDMLSANKAEDAKIYARQEEERRQQYELELKQKELDAKVVNLSTLRQKKETEKAVSEMRQKFLSMLPKLSKETISRIKNSLASGNPEEFYAAFDIAIIEAGLRG